MDSFLVDGAVPLRRVDALIVFLRRMICDYSSNAADVERETIFLTLERLPVCSMSTHQIGNAMQVTRLMLQRMQYPPL